MLPKQFVKELSKTIKPENWQCGDMAIYELHQDMHWTRRTACNIAEAIVNACISNLSHEFPGKMYYKCRSVLFSVNALSNEQTRRHRVAGVRPNFWKSASRFLCIEAASQLTYQAALPHADVRQWPQQGAEGQASPYNSAFLVIMPQPPGSQWQPPGSQWQLVIWE